MTYLTKHLPSSVMAQIVSLNQHMYMKVQSDLNTDFLEGHCGLSGAIYGLMVEMCGSHLFSPGSVVSQGQVRSKGPSKPPSITA